MSFESLFDREPTKDDEMETLLAAARALPKIPDDDPRVASFLETGERTYARQFGNNFYLLWLSLRDSHADSPIKMIYADRAKALPGWEGFVAQNGVVIGEVDTVIDELYIPYEVVSLSLLDLINSGQHDTYQRFREEVGHPLGFQGANLLVWDYMNDALGKVAEQMDISGIDPAQFYG